LWKAVERGQLKRDAKVDFYSDECVGCLACETVCPANVPYREMIEQVRHRQIETGKRLKLHVAIAGRLVRYPKLFSRLLMPARLLRRLRLLPHPLVFNGKPPVTKTTAAYARQLNDQHNPQGPRVALLTGCLMDGLFREINFATIRVLIRLGYRVEVPEDQACCGAFLEHTGQAGLGEMAAANRLAFDLTTVDKVVVNSAGCGLSLKKVLGEDHVQDVLGFLEAALAKVSPKQKLHKPGKRKLFVDLPCHLVHGQGVTISPAVLDATGFDWSYAPCAKDCCGSGGVYNILKPANADAILREKSAFINDVPVDTEVILATSNHVCMMQWQRGRRFVKRPYRVAHVIQLLDDAISETPIIF
jgi:glycolate oxidase iron-sulfur subunit